jgi:hypothetical protein
MRITTKVEIKDYDIKIPKGITGVVVGVTWGDKCDGFVVDFPTASRVYVARENAIMEVENELLKSHEKEEGQISKQKRKKELPAPTVGKGSEPNT